MPYATESPRPLPSPTSRIPEERFEDARDQFFRDTRAGVRDADAHDTPSLLARDVNRAATDQRLLCIGDQVQEHLLQLVLITEECRNRAKRGLDGDAACLKAVPTHLDHARQDGIDIHGRGARTMLASEIEEVTHDASRALRLLFNDSGCAAQLIARKRGEQLRVTEDGGEWIVQLMRHAGNEFTERGQPLRILSALHVRTHRV